VTDVYTVLPLDVLEPAPDNPRGPIDLDAPAFTDLVASVEAAGVVVPLLVTPVSDSGLTFDEMIARGARYRVVAGHRRLEAARAAGLEVVPTIVRYMDETARLTTMLMENSQRVDLNAVEEATGYFGLIGLGMKVSELAERVGRSAPHVSRRLALLQLPGEVLDMVRANTLSATDAVALVELVDAGVPDDRVIAAATWPKVDWAIARELTSWRYQTNLALRTFTLIEAGYKVVHDMDDTLRYVEDLGLDGDGEWHRRADCAVVVLSQGDDAAVVERQACRVLARTHAVWIGPPRRTAADVRRDRQRWATATRNVLARRLKREEILRFTMPAVLAALPGITGPGVLRDVMGSDVPLTEWAAGDVARSLKVLLAWGLLSGAESGRPEARELLEEFGGMAPYEEFGGDPSDDMEGSEE
jgi:ParB/RepB/Spo0J family partition protein